MTQDIVYESKDGIATILLNRPEKRNAVTAEMVDRLTALVDRADEDDNVRAIVVAANGDVFCGGFDLSGGASSFELIQDTPMTANGAVDYSDPRIRDGAGKLTIRIYNARKPVIGAIQGAAVGFGMSMICSFDVRFASEGTRFSMMFTRRGMVPEAASSWFLSKQIGMSRAMQWTLSGRMIQAEEALDAGFLAAIHPKDELLESAYAYAREIVEYTSPVSVALTRQMLWRMASADHPMEAHRIESRGIFSRGRSADAREGVDSFLEKRTPNFPDRVSKDMPNYFPWWEEPEYN